MKEKEWKESKLRNVTLRIKIEIIEIKLISYTVNWNVYFNKDTFSVVEGYMLII